VTLLSTRFAPAFERAFSWDRCNAVIPPHYVVFFRRTPCWRRCSRFDFWLQARSNLALTSIPCAGLTEIDGNGCWLAAVARLILNCMRRLPASRVDSGGSSPYVSETVAVGNACRPQYLKGVRASA